MGQTANIGNEFHDVYNLGMMISRNGAAESHAWREPGGRVGQIAAALDAYRPRLRSGPRPSPEVFSPDGSPVRNGQTWLVGERYSEGLT